MHSFTGNTDDAYKGPSRPHASVYILRLRSSLESTRALVHLHEGPEPSGAFPLLPADPRVHTLGVGMSSVTLSWGPSASVGARTHKSYNYCVLVNSRQNYPSLCAARESTRKEKDQRRGKKAKRGGVTAWPMLNQWWWRQWDPEPRSPPSTAADQHSDLQCTCQGTENVCTVSELLPDTLYYFDVFVLDRINGTSAAYRGTFARTHEEARAAVTPLREGELRWVTFDGGSDSEQLFSFRPRGLRHSGLLTLQSCGRDESIKVTVSSKSRALTSQVVTADLSQIWLDGSPSYLVHLEREGSGSYLAPPSLPGGLMASVKMQVSSAYHRRGVPSLPTTLQIKSFNRLRGCNSVTLAWMGTEERSLYCVYRRKMGTLEKKAPTAPCLGPESRSDTERVLCKYFQELNPQRAVTTAVIGGLEPGVAYVFDVYLMRRWGIPIKYASKVVKTRKDC